MTRKALTMRRMISVALFLLLIIGGLWSLIGLTLWVDGSVRSTQAVMARYDRLSAEKQALEAQIATLRAQRRDGPGDLLPGASTVQAGAAFQDTVKQRIARLGGRVQSLESLPETQENGFERLSLRLTATITHSRLQSFLYDLETGRPAIIIDRFLSRPATQRSAARRRQQAGEAVDLEITATLSAFRSLSIDEAPP